MSQRNQRRSLPVHKGNDTFRGNNNFKIYESKASIPHVIKETVLELKAQIDSKTIIVEDIATPLSLIDRSSKKVNQRHLRIKGHSRANEEYFLQKLYNTHLHSMTRRRRGIT
jgi:hypothetical protein